LLRNWDWVPLPLKREEKKNCFIVTGQLDLYADIRGGATRDYRFDITIERKQFV